MKQVRKGIIDYLTANGASTKEAIVADCCNTLSIRPRRVEHVLDTMTDGGKVVKTDDNYSIA